MKVRVTMMTENNVPVSDLGPNPEATIKESWQLLLSLLSAGSKNEDHGYVESVEIVEE